MKLVVFSFTVFTASLAGIKSYEVEPVKPAWSGWTRSVPGLNVVSQTITANFDSLVWVELFVGDLCKNPQNRFDVEVWEMGGQRIVKRFGVSAPDQGNKWLRFETEYEAGKRFVRGKQYEIRFIFQGKDSIQFYYDLRNPYRYGEMLRGVALESADLCMRVYGEMKVVDGSWWGFMTSAYDTVLAARQRVPDKVRSAGGQLDRMDLFWESIWTDSTAEFDFQLFDDAVSYSKNRMGCKVIGILDYSAPWARTRFDSKEPSPPRNLYLDVWHPSNYWARYVEAVASHFDTTIVYEIYNEPNDTARFWKVPEFHYKISDPVSGLCSLYARLCEVATSVIDSITKGRALVLVGSLAAMQPSIHTRIPPEEMLRYLYFWADKNLWDGVSFHPYQDLDFDITLFESQVESLRSVMRANGDDGELWITEIGWPSCGPPIGCGEEQQANWVCEAFVSARASQTLPGGGYDRICFYSFLARGDTLEGSYGILDTFFQPKPAYYALSQTFHILSGKRYHGRVMLGDARDDSVRIYEFEDLLTGKRVWVAWRNFSTEGDAKRTVKLRLRVRSDTLDEILLAYDNYPAVRQVTAEIDGYLNLNLRSRPVFVVEKSAPRRPDLTVDSVRLFSDTVEGGADLTVKVWLSNIGDRIPGESLSIRLEFYHNSVLVSELREPVVDLSLGPQQSTVLTYKIPFLPAFFEEDGLFSVVVNRAEDFVEMSMDNNRAYWRTRLTKP
ncbi:MAG: hypothetical protein ACUVUD_03340 [bacterium]